MEEESAENEMWELLQIDQISKDAWEFRCDSRGNVGTTTKEALFLSSQTFSTKIDLQQPFLEN